MKKLSALACLGLATVFGMTGCDLSKPTFSSSSKDVTGSPYGRDFRVTDQDGKAEALSDFRGKVVMLVFGYTQCPDVCPTVLARAAEVREKLGPDASRLQVIFFTVDPERDTPSRLRTYVSSFDLSFIAISTNALQTRQVADEFHVQYRKVPTSESYTVDHTALSYLFDPEGHLRLTVRYDFSPNQVVNDVRKLLRS